MYMFPSPTEVGISQTTYWLKMYSPCGLLLHLVCCRWTDAQETINSSWCCSERYSRADGNAFTRFVLASRVPILLCVCVCFVYFACVFALSLCVLCALVWACVCACLCLLACVFACRVVIVCWCLLVCDWCVPVVVFLCFGAVCISHLLASACVLCMVCPCNACARACGRRRRPSTNCAARWTLSSS